MSTCRRLVTLAALAAVAALTAAAAGPRAALAATPGSGGISNGQAVQWDFAPVGGPGTVLSGGPSYTACAPPNCDPFDLTVNLPAVSGSFYAPDAAQGTVNAGVLTVTISWASSIPNTVLDLAGFDPAGKPVGLRGLGLANSGSGSTNLYIDNPVNGRYRIEVYPVTALTPTASHARATLRLKNLTALAEPVQSGFGPRFQNYVLPESLMPLTPEEQQVLHHRGFGEPSIGVDPKTDAVMYQAFLFTMRAQFDDGTVPAQPNWKNVSAFDTSVFSEDAMLAVDRGTGRTLVSQLTLACSLGAVSDDDGATWQTSPHPCQIPPDVDHQTIGAGPFAQPLPNPGPVYPDAVYYCSQNIGYAACGLSLDGGLDYGTGTPMYTSLQCFGLHGHVKVGPDGTVYVPNKACGAPECRIVTNASDPNCKMGLVTSRDNGNTWTVNLVPDSHIKDYGSGDPSVAVGAGGTVYFGYDDRSGHPKIATLRNGQWGPSVDVGAAFGIENTQMPVVIAGDDDRAAFAFLGTTAPGDDQSKGFTGVWYLYTAFTYDGGRSWTTYNLTPHDPVQRGCIEFGSDCPSPDQRNLLDFNDGTLDREGRVLVAYTDGCVGACVTDPGRTTAADHARVPSLARQTCGLGLYARYDPGFNAGCPQFAIQPAATPTPAPGSGASGGTQGAIASLPFSAGPVHSPPVPALAAGGLLALAGLGIAAWRRRRRASG